MVIRGRGDVWRLAAGSAASNTGNWAATVALALVVYARTGSAAWLSAGLLFTQVPSALAAPLSGMIADRLDRKRTMIICDLLGAAAYAAMAVTGSPLGLITLGAVAALLHSPFGPASRAAVPNLAGDGDLAWANGTLAAASNAGQLAGPALGGVLYAVAGAGGAFAANAISFVVSAALIAAVRGRFRSTSPDTETSTPQTGSIWAGARFLWRDRTLLTLTAVGAVTFLATEIAAVADLPLIRHFGAGGVGYGIMNVAWGAGGLTGALIAARIVSKDNETAAAVLGVLVLGIFVAAVGISPWFALVRCSACCSARAIPSPSSVSAASTSAAPRTPSAAGCSPPSGPPPQLPPRRATGSQVSWSPPWAGAWSTWQAASSTSPAQQYWPSRFG
jgi:MFS family permease